MPAEMASGGSSLTCPICSHRFRQKSSLVRHSKRCTLDAEPPGRRKSCRDCVASKARCDLQRPACGRCQARQIECEFARQGNEVVDESRVDASEVPATTNSPRQNERLSHDDCSPSASFNDHQPESTDSAEDTATLSLPITPVAPPPDIHGANASTPADLAPELFISETRRQILLGTAPNSPLDSGAVSRHIMSLVIRTLRSWPRLMDLYHTAQSPPIIHKVQLENGVPTPLANCYTLIRMWSGRTEGSDSLVRNTIVSEVQRLLREYSSYGELELLATAQSLLILLIVLFFALSKQRSSAMQHPTDAELLIEVWGVTQSLTATGLFLDQEVRNTVPSWRDWAIVAAKRRTILALHHVEWAWSQLHGYPVLTCFELSPLPAPAPGFLWREQNELCWWELYTGWLQRWPMGSYKMAEIFQAASGDGLGVRGEMWLAEADEFGMMLVAELNATDDLE